MSVRPSLEVQYIKKAPHLQVLGQKESVVAQPLAL